MCNPGLAAWCSLFLTTCSWTGWFLISWVVLYGVWRVRKKSVLLIGIRSYAAPEASKVHLVGGFLATATLRGTWITRHTPQHGVHAIWHYLHPSERLSLKASIPLSTLLCSGHEDEWEPQWYATSRWHDDTIKCSRFFLCIKQSLNYCHGKDIFQRPTVRTHIGWYWFLACLEWSWC